MKKPHFLKACPTEFLFNKNTSKKPLGFGFSVLGERPHLSPSVFGSLFRGDIYLGGPGSSSLGSAHPRRPRVLLGPKAEPWRVARGPRTKPFAVSGMRHAQDCHPVALKLNGSPLMLYFQKKIIFSSMLFFLRRFRPAKAGRGAGASGGASSHLTARHRAEPQVLGPRALSAHSPLRVLFARLSRANRHFKPWTSAWTLWKAPRGLKPPRRRRARRKEGGETRGSLRQLRAAARLTVLPSADGRGGPRSLWPRDCGAHFEHLPRPSF